MEVEEMWIFDGFFLLLGYEPVDERDEIVESVSKNKVVTIDSQEYKNVDDFET